MTKPFVAKLLALLVVAGVMSVGAGTVLAPGHSHVSSRAVRLPMPGQTPPRVLQILDRSCADCHSDETRWPWYSSVPPVSWMVARHVREGRRYLNLSRFDSRAGRDQRDILQAIVREVGAGRMPLESYTLIHRDARLSPADVLALREWARRQSQRLADIHVHEETGR